MSVPYKELYDRMRPVLQSKCEELQLYEYKDVMLEQLWLFCVERKWRKKNIEEIRPHEMVAAILSISPADLMQYAQTKEMSQHDHILEISQDELDLLLGLKSDEPL